MRIFKPGHNPLRIRARSFPLQYVVGVLLVLVTVAPELFIVDRFSKGDLAFIDIPYRPGQVFAQGISFHYLDHETAQSVTVSSPHMRLRSDELHSGELLFSAEDSQWIRQTEVGSLAAQQLVSFSVQEHGKEPRLSGLGRSVSLFADLRGLGLSADTAQFGPSSETITPPLRLSEQHNVPSRPPLALPRTPISVQAEQDVVIVQKEQTLSSEGPTKILWGDYELRLANLEIAYDPQSRDVIDTITSEGQFELSWPGGKLQAEKLVYDGERGTLTVNAIARSDVAIAFANGQAALGKEVRYELEAGRVTGKGPFMLEYDDTKISAPEFAIAIQEQQDGTARADWISTVYLLGGIRAQNADIEITGDQLVYVDHRSEAQICGTVTASSRMTVVTGDCLTLDVASGDFRLTGKPARGWFSPNLAP